MFKLNDRVKESSITSGSGASIVLLGAFPGFQSFSTGIGDGNTTFYTIENGSRFEVGIGTYSSVTNSLSRDTVLRSSSGGSRITLDGVSIVFCTYPADYAVFLNGGFASGLYPFYSGIAFPDGTKQTTAYLSTGDLPVKSISGGYGIGVTNVSGNHTIYSTVSTVGTVDEAYSLVSTVFNETQTPIPKFTAVYISGGHGDMPTMALALASAESKSSKTYGITQEIIPAMSSGHVVVYGTISGINTDQFNPNAPQGDINGQVLYLSPTVSGGFTTTKPSAPNHLVALGTVIRTHQNQGVFNVRIQNGFEIEELHNVAISTPVSGQFVKYDGSLWRNSGITSSDISDFTSAVSGISPNISISGTSGINVNKNGSTYTVYTTGNFGLTSSEIQQLLNSGVNIVATGGSGNFSYLNISGYPVETKTTWIDLGYVTGVDFPSNRNAIYTCILDINPGQTGVFTLPTGTYDIQSGDKLRVIINNQHSGINPYIIRHKIPGTIFQPIQYHNLVSGILSIAENVGDGLVSYEFINLLGSYSDWRLVQNTHAYQHKTGGYDPLLPSDIGAIASSGGVFTGPISGTSGNFDRLTVNNIDVSTSGHTHTSTNIINFNTSVSGLVSGIYAPLNSPAFVGIPTVPTAASGTNTTQIASTAFVRTEVSNLVASAPSTLDTLNELAAALGNDPNFATTVTNLIASKVSKSGDTMTGSLNAPSGIFSQNVTVGGINVSLSGHTHTSSQITDFNSATSGLIPITGVSGSGYAVVSTNNKLVTVSITGLQPSGNYSVVGHTHLSSDITNFNSSVSDLLPSVSGSGYAQVNFANNTYTVSVSGLQPSGNYSIVGHTHTASNITDFNTATSGLLTPYALLSSGNFNNLFVGGVPVIGDPILEYNTTADFPAVGDTNILYLALNRGQFYKWDGAVYYEAGPQGASTGTHAGQHKTNGSDPITLVEYVVPVFSANANNLVHNNRDVLYLDGDANNRELSGMVAPAFSCTKLLVNIDASYTIIIKHQSTNSDPANRFLNYTGVDYYLLPGQSLSVLYDTNASRWRVL